MLERVISGGQSGADIAGLRAAKFVGIPTGGSAAKGWLVESENGREHIPAPWLKTGFGLVECQQGSTISARYVARRRANVMASDGTLLFFKVWTPGTKGVLHDLREVQKPVALILAKPEAFDRDNPYRDYLGEFGVYIPAGSPEEAADWIRREEIATLNIAGPRASTAPKMEAFAFEYLTKVFQLVLAETTTS